MHTQTHYFFDIVILLEGYIRKTQRELKRFTYTHKNILLV